MMLFSLSLSTRFSSVLLKPYLPLLQSKTSRFKEDLKERIDVVRKCIIEGIPEYGVQLLMAMVKSLKI